jgi:hypothetical protein
VLFKRPRSQISSGKYEQVKNIEQDCVLGAAEILAEG